MSVTTAERLLTAQEVADRLRVSQETVYRMARRVNNPLPAVRIGDCVRFHWPQIAAWAGFQDAEP